MLNWEETNLVKGYQGSREEVLAQLKAAKPHVKDTGLVRTTENAIRELEGMSDEAFSMLTAE